MASDSDSDSSVEDESQRQRLLDAAVDVKTIVRTAEQKSGHVETQTTVSRNLSIPNIPSKRPSKTIEHDEKNDLNTTPEFKAFVAKKLSQMLDQEVEEQEIDNRSLNSTGYEDTGIRLCLGSRNPLTTDGNPEDIPVHRTPVPRKRSKDSSTDSSEDERLAAAAVSHDFIIKQSKISIGSQDDQSVVIKATDTNSHQNGKDYVSNVECTEKNNTEDNRCTKQKKKKKKKDKKHKHIKENC